MGKNQMVDPTTVKTTKFYLNKSIKFLFNEE